MKKLLSLLLALFLVFSGALSLASCAPADDHKVTVAYLSGSTGIGMAKMISDDKDVGNYNFSGYLQPTNLLTELRLRDCPIDIATLPTNVAASIYNETEGRYRVVALNTLGVLYIATNGVAVNSIEDLRGKTVYVPEPAPAAILEHVLAVNGIPVVDSHAENENGVVFDRSLNLVGLPTALATRMKVDEGKYVEIGLLPEPKLTVAETSAQQNGTPLTIALDLTAEWNKKIDTPMVQGCVVASSDFIENHSGLLKDFLNEYEQSILYMDNSDNLNQAAEMVVSLEILPQKPIAMRAIPRSNITYIDGEEMKEILAPYLAALGPSLMGGKLPDDNFYAIVNKSIFDIIG